MSENGTDAFARFVERVEMTETCWLWIGYRDRLDYGIFYFGGRNTYAHRWAYEYLVEPVASKLHLDHLCRTPACVNPDHLEPVTSRENMLRGVSPSAQSYRTNRCHRGHEFTPENTKWKKKGRQCRACYNAASRRAKALRKSVAA